MMDQKRTTTSGHSRKASIWPRVLGIGALAFALFLLMFIGYEILMSVSESSAAQTAAAQQPPIVIDEKLANDLAIVLAADQSPNLQEVKDPFTDTAGLSSTSTGTTTSSSSTAGTSSSSGGSSSTTSSGTGSGSTTGSGSSSPAAVAPPSATEATRNRYNEWVARVTSFGDMPLDPRIFAIEDLLPVGIVDGGSGNQEVMFFSEGAGRTVSFMVGTMFYDGRLTELRPEGVVFSSLDGKQPVRMRSWARSIKTGG